MNSLPTSLEPPAAPLLTPNDNEADETIRSLLVMDNKNVEEEDEEWAHFEDTEAVPHSDNDDDDVELSIQPQQEALRFEFTNLPKQLHPAVSIGARRVSSCYFSIGSDSNQQQQQQQQQKKLSRDNLSLADIWSQFEDEAANSLNAATGSSADAATATDQTRWTKELVGTDVLYHDILMHVFTYLDAPSLSSFSETAKRPNFEVFYFLQLQLQRSLLVKPESSSTLEEDSLATIAGSSCLSRLARLAPAEAQQIVDDFSASNASLRTMPLSHSLAYFRRVLQHHGFPSALPPSMRFSTTNPSSTSTTSSLASAAVFVTFMGAAVLSGSTTPEAVAEALGNSVEGVLPNMLFRVGFVGSAALMARRTHQIATTQSPKHKNETSGMEGGAIEADDAVSSTNEQPEDSERQIPSGSVGAYSKAIRQAADAVADRVKRARKERFYALSDEDQRELSLAFLDACSSDNSLERVRELTESMDVNAFFVGSDGSETCALHTASYHGATEVIRYLCAGVSLDDDNDSGLNDGGLCDVNLRDANGWTALHFAAGANQAASIQTLAECHATLDLQANNGYTPLQWATRLSSIDATDTLKNLLTSQRTASHQPWMSSRPLTEIAHRFFSLIPIQS